MFVPISQEIDMEEDWKLVTMWIGGNNLCDYCKNKVGSTVLAPPCCK